MKSLLQEICHYSFTSSSTCFLLLPPVYNLGDGGCRVGSGGIQWYACGRKWEIVSNLSDFQNMGW